MGYGPKQPKLGLNPDFGGIAIEVAITAAYEWVRVLGGSTESFAELGLGFWQLTGANANFSELGLGWGLFFSNQVCTSAPKVMDIPRFIPLRTQFVCCADGHMLESSKGISLQTCNLRSRGIFQASCTAGLPGDSLRDMRRQNGKFPP